MAAGLLPRVTRMPDSSAPSIFFIAERSATRCIRNRVFSRREHREQFQGNDGESVTAAVLLDNRFVRQADPADAFEVTKDRFERSRTIHVERNGCRHEPQRR